MRGTTLETDRPATPARAGWWAPAADALERARRAFLASSLVCATLLGTLLAAEALTGRPGAALAIPVLVAVGAKWIAEFRGLRPRAALDAGEALTLMAVAVAAGNPLTILMPFYLRVSQRGLDASRRQATVIAVASAAAFTGAVLIEWSSLGLTQAASDLLLGFGIPVAATVMQAVGTSLVQQRSATAQERALREAEADAHFRQLFDASPQPMWLYDEETRGFLAVNDAALRHYGYSRDEFLTMCVGDLSAPTGETGCAADGGCAGADPFDGDRRHRLRDGRVIDVDISRSHLHFRGRAAVLALARDVTERHELHRRLEHQAFHDALTGLPNRPWLEDQVRTRLARITSRSRTRPAMLVFDLDGFKTVNDSRGHAFGDRVIAEVGARLRKRLRAGDVAARLGGDEFAVFLSRTSSTDEALAVARRFITSLQRPFTVEGQPLVLSASVGVAFPRPEHDGVEDLISDADVAMYAAKTQGAGSCVVFETVYRDALLDRLGLQEDLGKALARDELSVQYQPQLDLRTGRVVAMEALARWKHPSRGSVPPDVFIPLAEQLGLVAEIDEAVLRTACRQLRRWCEESGHSLRLAVNLSGRDLERPDFVSMVRTILLECMLDPWQLELELTESVAVSQPEAAVARLAELRAIGVRIAIDDFGTGYSMLTRLRRLPADRLKIDRSFVTDIARDDDARTIVRSTITMGHALGLDLVAEGVESVAAAAVLTEMGCDYAQGYHFSRPLPAEQMTEWLRQRALFVPSASVIAV